MTYCLTPRHRSFVSLHFCESFTELILDTFQEIRPFHCRAGAIRSPLNCTIVFCVGRAHEMTNRIEVALVYLIEQALVMPVEYGTYLFLWVMMYDPPTMQCHQGWIIHFWCWPCQKFRKVTQHDL